MTQRFMQLGMGLFLLLLAACGGNAAPPSAPFALEPSAQNLEVIPGGVSSFFVNLKRQAGFGDTVNMTFEGLPDGITQRWSRDTENGDCTVQLTVDPETPEGSYSITLKGSSAETVGVQSGVQAQATNTQTVTVTVQNTTTPGGSGAQGFTLSFTQAVVSIRQTNTISTRAIVTPVNGFSQDVTFSVSNLPPNVSVQVDQGGPNNQFLSDKFQAFLRFTAGANSVPGDYTVTVRAQSANFGRTETLQLKILPQGDPTPTFVLFSDAVSLTVRQGGEVLSTFRLERRNGFTAPITVEPQLAPFPGVTFTRVNTLSGDNVLILFSASASAAITNGLFQGLTVRATGGGITRQLLILFKVEPKPGGQDSSFLGALGGFGGSKEQAIAASTNQHFVAGKLTTDDGFIKLNNEGRPDTSFGTSNGIAVRAGLSSATASFSADSAGFLAGNNFPVRVVGRLIPTNVGDGSINLAILGFSADGRQNFIKSLEFSGSIRNFGSEAPVRAILQADRTIVTGTITPDLTKCFLAIITNAGDVPVKKEFRFNNLSTDSTCRSIAAIPGNPSRFYVGGSQTVVTQVPMVAKVGPDGEFDKNFAGDGVARLEGLDTITAATALAVQSNGKILVGLNSQGAIARLNTDGKFDPSFGQNGVVRLNPPNLSGAATKSVTKLTIGTNGVIFALIQNKTTSNSSGANVAKLNSSGVLQASFGNGGFLDTTSAQDILAVASNTPTLLVLEGGLRRFFQ
jgi:hypothetical protein